MTTPATEGALGSLHNKVAVVMTNALNNIELAQERWANSEPVDGVHPEDPPEVNPALLSVMVRFLDANKITCAPEAGTQMSDLERSLAAKKRKRVGNVVNLRAEDE